MKYVKAKTRHCLRYLLCLGLYYSGFVALVRGIRGLLGHRRVVILTYHSFSDTLPYLNMAISPRLFSRQVEYLCRVFRVLTLTDVLEACDRHVDERGDLAAITVDDGYADNFLPLREIAARFGARSTVFLTTNCIDNREPTTVMWVMMAIHYAKEEMVRLPEIDVDLLPIRTRSQKEYAIGKIDLALKPLSEDKRKQIVTLLLERTGSAAQVQDAAKSIMLDWQQVAKMHSEGVEFGAHTLSHPVLSLLEPSAARKEIVESLKRVRDRIGNKEVCFAYPYGSKRDVAATTVEICRSSGASSAVLLMRGATPGGDRFKVPRAMVTSDQSTAPWGGFSKAMWACELEGIVDVVRGMATRTGIG